MDMEKTVWIEDRVESTEIKAQKEQMEKRKMIWIWQDKDKMLWAWFAQLCFQLSMSLICLFPCLTFLFSSG